MAFTLTPSLKLRVNSDLTADSIYNLNRIDTVGAAVTTDSQGQIKIRSRLDILLEPDSIDINGEGTAGAVSLGEAGRPILNVNVNSQNLNLLNTKLNLDSSDLVFLLNPNTLTVKAPSSISSSFTLTLPDNPGQLDYALVTNGEGVLSFKNLESPLLLENRIEIGGVGDVRTQTNTAGVGDILASTVSGLSIKPERIMDSMVSPLAGITYDKLAPLTFDRVLISNSSGVLEESEITVTELNYLDGAIGNIQAQINSLGGGGQYTELWEPGDGLTKSITHPLNSQALVIQVLNIAADYATIEVATVTRPDLDTVVLTSSEAPSSNWLVLINKIGI